MHGLAKEFVQYVYITEPSTPSTTPVWEAKSSWDLMFCKGWLSFTKLFGCFQFTAFVYGSIFLSKNGKLVIFLFSEGPRRSFLSALGEGGEDTRVSQSHHGILQYWRSGFHSIWCMWWKMKTLTQKNTHEIADRLQHKKRWINRTDKSTKKWRGQSPLGPSPSAGLVEQVISLDLQNRTDKPFAC